MIKAHFEKIRPEILKEISTAEKSIKIAMAWFTNLDLFHAIIDCLNRKIKVDLIIIKDSINLRPFGLDFDLFIHHGGSLYFGDDQILMHHKFCIIDDKVLINGSYNWTYWAESRNNENITVIKDESKVLGSFKKEYRKLITNKAKIENIKTVTFKSNNDDDNFFNLKNLIENEYIYSAIDLGASGNIEKASKIFEVLNLHNPRRANNIIQSGIKNDSRVWKGIYERINSSNDVTLTARNYVEYCADIERAIKQRYYIQAIKIATECQRKFLRKFSVHVYCGDAKMYLNDKAGAIIEYGKALNYSHKKGNTIVYYNKKYNYPFFPKADVYVKMGNYAMAIKTLENAVSTYSLLKMTVAAQKAQLYSERLKNDEPVRIE